MLLLEDQLKALRHISSVETNPVFPPIHVETLGVEQEEVVEGLCGKVKGLEQQIQTERYAFEGLRGMVFGLSEKVDSSIYLFIT